MSLVIIQKEAFIRKNTQFTPRPRKLNVWIIEVFFFSFSLFRSDFKRVSQEFLKSEVSAENILFYQACEKFKKIPPTKLEEVCNTLLFLLYTFFFLYINENRIWKRTES